MSKVLEKIVAARLEAHYIRIEVQSAYRSGHSTETALLRVYHELTLALDRNCCAVLILMLDLSAAFATINHTILL